MIKIHMNRLKGEWVASCDGMFVAGAVILLDLIDQLEANGYRNIHVERWGHMV